MQRAPDITAVATVYVHVRILMGLIVGLGLTHVLRHLARFIERPAAHRMYGVHLVWCAFMFVYLLHFWWWEFRLADRPYWDFELYLFVILYSLLFYLLCTLLLPDELEEGASYESYYYSRRRWFFGLLALAFVLDLADTWIKGEAYFHSLGREYLWRNTGYVLACIGAILTTSRRYHAAFAVGALLYELSWIARRYDGI
jgi:hypothetical protein